MPFQSEKQRKYLWANEPEIARDWADTYGSRIESNTGGISRLGFAYGPSIRPVDDGPVYRANEPVVAPITEDDEENPLEKFMRFMQGNAGQLSQADVNANKKFLQTQGMGGGNVRFAQNNPYQMYNPGGPFHGMNAPGSSAFGSKNPQEMAAKWMKKFGKTAPTKKVNMMSEIAQGNQGNNMGGYQHPGSKASIESAGDPMAQGGIMRLGYANGPAGGASAGGDYGGNVNPQQEYAGRTFQETYGGPYQDQIMQGGTGIKEEIKPPNNILGGIMGAARHIGPFLGKKAPYIKGAVSIYDIINNAPKDEEVVLSADDSNHRAEVTKGNLSTLKAMGIYTPGKKSAYKLDEVSGGQLVPGTEKITDLEWADILQGTYTV